MDFSTRKNGVRLLLLLAVVIGVAAVVQDLHFNNTQTSARTAVRGTDGEVSALQVTLADLRAAQAGYLTAGQDPNYWMRQASGFAQQVEAGFARLRGSVTSSEAHARLDAGQAAFEVLVEADNRARQAVADGERLQATDAIFTGSLEAGQRVASELASVRTAEIQAVERDAAKAAQIRLAVSGGAIGVVLLLMFVAVRLSQQPQPSAAATMAQMLRELPPPVKTAPAATPAPAAATVVKPPTPAPPPAPLVSLPDTAELCGDLARVIDERDVPGLLARAARLLEATGVIIWVADSDGSRLQPTLTHGYSEKVLSRLGTLDVEDDNMTSLAFRSMRSQQVGGGANSAGAIAVPLVTASGCTGVLAAEVRDARMASGDAIALARILAAQFATIIAPTPNLAAQAAEA